MFKWIKSSLDDIHKLPLGLREYYQSHWRAMKDRDRVRFEKHQKPVICILATVREPVSVAQVAEWTKLSPMHVKEVIDEWREFLNMDNSGQRESLYRIYHASFQDFLQVEVGLKHYDNMIAQTTLDKIQWWRK